MASLFHFGDHSIASAAGANLAPYQATRRFVRITL
jgi:hypothetical protein